MGRKRRYLGSGNPLTIEESWDGEQDLLQANQDDWSTIDFVYNALGWLEEDLDRYGPDVTKSWTVNSNFDAFGRPATITAPDNSVVSLAHLGDRRVTRTVMIGTSYNPVTRVVSETASTHHRTVRPSGSALPGRGTVRCRRSGGHDHVRLRRGRSPLPDMDEPLQRERSGPGVHLRQPGLPELGAAPGEGFLRQRHGQLFGLRRQGARRATAGGRRRTAISTYSSPTIRAERLTAVKETRLTAGAHRLLKEFSYGDGILAADRSRGKLKTATRHNWVPYGMSTADGLVTETYTYGGKGGRVSERVTAAGPIYWFRQTWTHNDLGKAATVTYPLCTFNPCQGEAPAPARTVAFNYAKGLLSSVPGYADSITYHSNAMLDHLDHANGVDYYLGVDPTGMKRIAYIRIEGQHLIATETRTWTTTTTAPATSCGSNPRSTPATSSTESSRATSPAATSRPTALTPSGT